MATKIKLVQTQNHADDHFIQVSDGKRLEAREVAGNMNFVVVESIQESADRGTITPITVVKTTPTLAESKKKQFESYRKMGLSESEAKAAAGLEERVLKSEDLFSVMLKSF